MIKSKNKRGGQLTTYIFGHKNPDTDTVCSSIALSYLKNKLGDKTVPKVLGDLNNETKFVLKYFGVEAPSYLNDVRIRIKNIKFDHKAYINENKSIDAAFKLMQKENTTAMPLVDDRKKLTGYVTLKELAKYLISGDREHIHTTMDNIIETLDAKVITKFDDEINGRTVIAGVKSTTIEHEFSFSNNTILIVGDRQHLLNYAIESHVSLIIIPRNVNIGTRIIKKAEKNKVNIIATELGSFEIATKISLSNYVKNININFTPVTVGIDDYYSDFKTMTHKINHTNYPVVNKKGECMGLIRLTGKAIYEKQQVILVDHNNMSQSVDGIEEAEILEIIDHHNLGAIGTSVPINFRSRPVGCTATMIYDMYLENKVTIPKNMAGLLLSAIISDTLLFTSPTTTLEDKQVANKLSKIVGVTPKKYGMEMLKAASSIKDKTVNEVIKGDFKSFAVNNVNFGIGQVITMDFKEIKENINDYVAKLNEMTETNFQYVFLFVNDILKNGSYVIYSDSAKDIVADGFGISNIHQGIFLPGIVSRKKQMLPSILNVLEGEA